MSWWPKDKGGLFQMGYGFTQIWSFAPFTVVTTMRTIPTCFCWWIFLRSRKRSEILYLRCSSVNQRRYARKMDQSLNISDLWEQELRARRNNGTRSPPGTCRPLRNGFDCGRVFWVVLVQGVRSPQLTYGYHVKASTKKRQVLFLKENTWFEQTELYTCP